MDAGPVLLIGGRSVTARVHQHQTKQLMDSTATSVMAGARELIKLIDQYVGGDCVILFQSAAVRLSTWTDDRPLQLLQRAGSFDGFGYTSTTHNFLSFYHPYLFYNRVHLIKALDLPNAFKSEYKMIWKYLK